ncbi:MAG: alpha/beta hydrolase [Nitratireductor sp.]|nr:alpha/beta hydrolase [Nitratireductor sp.]
MKRGLSISFGALVVILVTIALGPRPVIDRTIRFDAASIGQDIDQWLADEESKTPGLRPGAEKEIIWADPQTKARTPLAIIYVHGFSATKWEVRPVPDDVAKAYGANLFYMRLTGHGASGDAMASASMNAWVNDMAEAIAIGERIAERILIISTSTGATLATWAAGNARLMSKVVGMVLISPNYESRGYSIGLINMPWGRQLLPLIVGKTHAFEPRNEDQGKWWTTSYPSVAGLAMGALQKDVYEMDKTRITVPAFFVYSPNDMVIVPTAAQQAYDHWGGPKKLLTIDEAGDPSNHVLTGDILSPDTTARISGEIIEWVKTLKR